MKLEKWNQYIEADWFSMEYVFFLVHSESSNQEISFILDGQQQTVSG